jgi:hypothetical protein
MVASAGIGIANPVIASEAKQSRSPKQELDCFVARAPRDDGANVFDPIKIITF